VKIAFLIPDDRDELRRYELPSPLFGPAPDALLSGFAQLAESRPDCEVHVLSCSKASSPAPAKIYNDRIFYHQLPVSPLGYLKTLYSGCIRSIRTRLRSIRPDIVHGQGTERYCALAAVRSGFPNVLTIHGNMRSVAKVNRAKPFSFYWLAARLEAWTLPKTGGVIALSRYTQAKVKALTKRTWVIPNAVEERFFQLEPSSADSETQNPQLACLGTICHHKNQNWLIQALAPLQEQFGFALNLYGGALQGSPYTEEFHSLLERHRSWVRFHGHIPRSELPQVYARNSLILIPSLEDNCPMVVLEAMASGLPVIGSRIGGIPDLVLPEETGWLFESQNREDFQNVLRQALSSPVQLKERGENSRSVARSQFSPLKIAQRHLEVYKEVLSGSSP
jgi:glycosyltransferase involved in cell wall biosynthesis